MHYVEEIIYQFQNSFQINLCTIPFPPFGVEVNDNKKNVNYKRTLPIYNIYILLLIK